MKEKKSSEMVPHHQEISCYDKNLFKLSNQKNTMKKISIILLTCFLLLLVSAAYADIGRRPSMKIHCTYNNEEIDSIFYAELLECLSQERINEQASYLSEMVEVQQLAITEFDPARNCYWSPSRSPLSFQNLGRGDECTDSECNFRFQLPREFRLAVYVPSLDKVFLSDAIVRKNYSSRYEATLLPDGTIEIEETTSFLQSDAALLMKMFMAALVLTLFFELPIYFILLSLTEPARQKYSKKKKRILSTVFLANVISLSIVWFVFSLMGDSTQLIILAEMFAIIFEALFIKSLNKAILSIGKAFVLSLVANLASFFVGGLIFLLLLWTI